MTAAEEMIADAGEFVLGLGEARPNDPAFDAAVAAWRGHFAAIDASAPVMMPSPGLWSRIEASRAALKPAAPASASPFARFWDSLAIWRPVGMAGALASLVLAVLLATRIAGGPELPKLVAVLSAPDGRAAAIVNAYADGTVQLVPLDEIPVPEGRVLEVWTLQTRERGPVSLARMERARTLKLDLRGLSAAQVGHLFEITLEPAGGSPTGRPTGPILMKGLAATRL
jgi:anti-sigma-K factor RskA